jgi:two-component system, response regulator YesN
VKRARTRGPRTLAALVVSYLAILAIPVVLGTVVYLEAVSVASRDAADYNLAMLRQVQTAVDARVRAVNQMAWQIAGQGKVQEFLAIRSPLSVSDRLRALALIAELGAYSNLESFVDDLYIWFFRSDVIVTPTSLYDPELFYDSAPRFGPTTFAEWKSTLSSRRYFQAWDRARIGAPRTHGAYPITCVNSIPVRYDRPPEAALVLLMNASRVTELLEAVTSVNAASVQVIDEQDRVIASTGDTPPLALRYADLEGPQGSLKKRGAGGRLVVSYRSSTESRWKYVSVVRERDLLSRVRSIRTVTAVVVGLSVVLGLAAALALAHRSYRPIRRLARLVFGEAAVEDGRESELDGVARRFSEQRGTLVNTLLHQLLVRWRPDTSDIVEALAANGVSLGSGPFCVVVVRAPGVAVGPPVAERLRPAAAAGGPALLVATRYDAAALILSAGRGEPAEALAAEAQGRAAALVASLGASPRAAAGVGGVHAGVAGLQRAYREAVAALDYRAVEGAGVLVYRPSSGGGSYHYPMETEARIVAAVRAGDDHLALSLVEEVIDVNFRDSGVSIELLRCLMLDLVATAAKAAETLGAPRDDFAAVGALAGLEELAELRERLAAVLSELCVRARNGKRSHNERLKEALLRYVEENYADRNLSIASMARAFDLSPGYLSHFFKEQTGVNALESVNRRRVERARELLSDRRLTIPAVARAVGYSSDLALTRFFKRFEGRTPGRYRDELLAGPGGPSEPGRDRRN